MLPSNFMISASSCPTSCTSCTSSLHKTVLEPCCSCYNVFCDQEFFAITAALAISLSKPGCPEKCGNVTIPFPFGIGPECSAKDPFAYGDPYTIICQNASTPFLSNISMEVVKISLYGTFIVKLPVSPLNCSDVQRTISLPISLIENPFTISAHYNSLVVLGCKSSVWLRSDTMKTAGDPEIVGTIGGCTAICDANSTDTSCNGINCCQTTLPHRPEEVRYTYRSNDEKRTRSVSTSKSIGMSIEHIKGVPFLLRKRTRCPLKISISSKHVSSPGMMIS